MQDDKKKRLEALKKLSNPEPLKEMYVDDDASHYEDLRAKKDARLEEYKSDGQKEFLEMLDERERIDEDSKEGLSDEDRERIAAETLARKRRQMGLPTK